MTSPTPTAGAISFARRLFAYCFFLVGGEGYSGVVGLYLSVFERTLNTEINTEYINK